MKFSHNFKSTFFKNIGIVSRLRTKCEMRQDVIGAISHLDFYCLRLFEESFEALY